MADVFAVDPWNTTTFPNWETLTMPQSAGGTATQFSYEYQSQPFNPNPTVIQISEGAYLDAGDWIARYANGNFVWKKKSEEISEWDEPQNKE